MKKSLGALVILVVIVGAYFFYKSGNNVSGSHAILSNAQVTIKMLPFPLIIANDGSKNDSLLDLLLNKDNKIIDIHNGRLEFDNVLPFGSKLSFSGIYINFSYDHKENKVKFLGKIDNAIATSVDGEYYLNDKNNIVYNINFNSDLYKFIIFGNYKFLEEQDGVLEGNFTFNTKGIMQLLDLFVDHFYQKIGININEDESLSINGDYKYQDTMYSINNVVIKSKNLDATAEMSFNNENNSKFNLELGINYFNLDNTMDILKLNDTHFSVIKTYLFGYLKRFIEFYSGENLFTGKISGTKVVLNGNSISSIVMDVNSQSSPGLLVNKLDFTLPGESVFSSSGVIDANQYRPAYVGNISLDSKELNTLIHYLDKDLHLFKFVENTPFMTNSKITITPVLTAFYDVNVFGGGTIFGDWLYSNYNVQKIVHSDFNFSNFNMKSPAILLDHPLMHLVKRSNSKNFNERLLRLKAIKLLYDSDLQFNNIILNNKVLDQISCEIVLRPEVVQLNGIKVKSNNLNFFGDVAVNVKGVYPFLSLVLQGEQFDPDFVKYFSYVEPHISQNDEIESNDIKDNHEGILRVFRFDKFNGYVQLNFKNLSNAVFAATNFNFFAALKERAIQIEKLNASVLNGYLQVVGSMSFAPFTSSLSYSLRDINVNNIVTTFFKNTNFTGNLSSVGNFATNGQTIGEIFNNLNGTIKVQSNEVVANNFNINAYIAMYGKSPQSSVGKKTNPRVGSTTLSSLDGNIVIHQGIFSANKINFETSDNISGASNFNFRLSDYWMSSITSLAYIDHEGNIDGFNITLQGPIDRLKTQLGASSN